MPLDINNLSPEELVEYYNSGGDLSTLGSRDSLGSVSDTNPNVEESPTQSSEPLCSSGKQVKDENDLGYPSPSNPPVLDLDSINEEFVNYITAGVPAPLQGLANTPSLEESESQNVDITTDELIRPKADRYSNLSESPLPISSSGPLPNETGNQYSIENGVPSDRAIKNAPITSMAQNPRLNGTDFDGIDVANPVELLLLLDENLASGELKLHPWQIQFMVDFADPRHSKESPFQAAVQACNSSGKDKYIIAACAVWLCMRYSGVECPITSSSGNQLDNQTGAHIDRLCNKANAVFGKLWKVNYRYYEFQHTGSMGEPIPSTLKLFATDEAGKAEGYHPTEAGKRMAIFTSETKSIPEQITSALERCIGFTHRVDASSPGLPAGYFYDTCISGIPRSDITDIKELSSTQVIKYHITAYDCPHITHSEIERFASKLPGGKSNVVFKSGIMAEFGTTDEMVVIPATFVWRAIKSKTVWISETFNTGGLDLSDGGAETVLCVRNGNKHIATEAFKFEDTSDTIDYLEEKFKFYDLNHQDARVNADCCGLGKPMIDALRRRGWKNMRYVDSRHKASETWTYINLGTELFFHLRKLMENDEIILMNDKLMITQLSTRYYKINTKNIHALLTKLEQRSRGYPSPDRADALNLCFWDYKSTYVEQEIITPYEYKDPLEQQNKEIVPDFDLSSWAKRNQPKVTIHHVQENDLDDLREQISAFNKQRTSNRN